jgi:hypothetical protein
MSDFKLCRNRDMKLISNIMQQISKKPTTEMQAIQKNKDEEMTNRCQGKKDNNEPCRSFVSDEGDYCRHHLDQKQTRVPCACYLDDGAPCPYPAIETGFCEFHVDPKKCQGKTLLGTQCLLNIAHGMYCWNCKHQNSVPASIMTSIDKMRAHFRKGDEPVIPMKKAVTIKIMNNPQTKVVIADSFKKVVLEKPEDCCCCLEAMVERNSYRSLKCGHYCHLECLSKMMKAECPLCRCVIDSNFVPKWVMERILYNAEQNKANQVMEFHRALVAAEQNHDGTDDMEAEIPLDVNSSEEDDFMEHLSNGREMGFTITVDQYGNERLALVVLQ